MTPTTITEILDKHAAELIADYPKQVGLLRLIESIRADIAKLKVWTLKPLPWVPFGNTDFIARVDCRAYHIEQFCAGAFYRLHTNAGSIANFEDIGGKFTDLDQAKSAAQEHYEARMEPGLEKAI